MNITETVEGLERYPVNLRYPRDLRDNPEALRRVLIPTPTGSQVPLTLVADKFYRSQDVIKTEDARPNAWVYVDIKTSDIGGFVTLAKQKLAERVIIPAGYAVTWSGQFEYMQRAAERLRIVVPITLLLIFILLVHSFSQYHRAGHRDVGDSLESDWRHLVRVLAELQPIDCRLRRLHRPGRHGGRNRSDGAEFYRHRNR